MCFQMAGLLVGPVTASHMTNMVAGNLPGDFLLYAVRTGTANTSSLELFVQGTARIFRGSRRGWRGGETVNRDGVR